MKNQVLHITIKVVPSSGRQSITLDKSGTLKCFLKSPPEKGSANKELIKFLASLLGQPSSCVSIATGLTSRTKRLNISTHLTYDQVLNKLGIARQQTLFPL